MSPPFEPRTARMVLVDAAGEALGALPPVPVETPWWQDVEPVVRAVRQAHGIKIVVLRMLEAERAQAPGGLVTYLAEGEAGANLAPYDRALEDHPLRIAYARPGGPAADLAWAQGVLAAAGLSLAAAPAQMRTWNLSSLWRLETSAGAAWLKVLPRFLAREASVLHWLAGERAPRLIGGEGARVLMAEIPGRDLYGASLPELLEMVDVLVDLQTRRLGREGELLALGAADWRPPALIAAIACAFERTADELDAKERAALGAFVAGLPARMAAVAACGVPETLIHSDFHPGNVRGGPGAMTLIDWGEAGVGHPLLDQAAMFSAIGPDEGAAVRAHWARRWREAVPGSDPLAAFALLAPVAIAKQAAVYWNFLDHIEPSEHPYHRADPADRLRRAAAALAGP